ncbi:MAG: carboxynorspermidine decarboxylase [Desulfobacterales bacterium]|nr:carboxynorspermidine decarboxylase [Desulfobacterales bacterium]
MEIDLNNVNTPCYICSIKELIKNLEILDYVQNKTGCKILLALKAFAMFSVFPIIRDYLQGIAASSIDEARLGFEEFRKEVHACSPGYIISEFNEIESYSSHIVFNSFSQWYRFKNSMKKALAGIRINPEHSEVKIPIYDPCGKYSRLGVTIKHFEEHNLEGITGLHFHNLCEKNADSFARTLPEFEKKFGEFLSKMEWINFGGGHHITRDDYDLELLCNTILDFKNRYPLLDIYLEPGEAIALNTGVLVASVIDIIHNEIDIAILDTSAAAHMPDVLEVPYKPKITGAKELSEYTYNYRLGGMSCLAGDIIGDYSFQKPLKIGSKIVFEDMAHYTMVKNNTFNGIRLPSIATLNANGSITVVKKFGYEDYKNRLS